MTAGRRAIVGLLLLFVMATDARAQDPARAKLARKLVIAGELVFAAGYTFSVGTSLAIGLSCGGEPGDPLCQKTRYLWGALPLAGPWVQLGYDHDFASTVALYTVPALVQAGGVGLIIAGIVVHERARPR